MNPFWPYASGFATEDVVPTALELLNQTYVIGTLRAVIPRAGDGWEELVALVLMYERCEEATAPVALKAFKRLTNGQGSAFIAGRAAYRILRTDGERVDYCCFAAACDAILGEPEDAPGGAWRRAVNSLVDSAA